MKTLVITGGSSGIGKTTAELFAKKGYKVYELSRRGTDFPAGITHITCDVTDPDACKAAIAEIPVPIDVLISNAGMGISGAAEFCKTEDIRRQMDVNFMGAVNITQAVLPVLRRQGSGRIIFVSSLAGIFALPFQAFYSASKFAINGFAQALANEVRPFGIKVAVLLPGDVRTGFTQARKKEVSGSDVYLNANQSVAQMEHDEQNGIAPERMACKLFSLAESRDPEEYSTVGFLYNVLFFFRRFVPQKFITYIIGRMYARNEVYKLLSLTLVLTFLSAGNVCAQDQVCYGDLNHDGCTDKVEVTLQDPGQPVLSVYFGQVDGGFRLFKTYPNVLPRKEDEFEILEYAVSINPKGVLKLAFDDMYSAGSYEARSYSNLYRYQKDDFYLIGQDDTIMIRNTGKKTVTSINYVTHRKQVVTAQLAPEGDAPVKTGEKWSAIPAAPLQKLGAKNLKRED